jgi:hypothetical protein
MASDFSVAWQCLSKRTIGFLLCLKDLLFGSVIEKSVPEVSPNCREKDEFMLLKRLQQNWKTGKFQVRDAFTRCLS